MGLEQIGESRPKMETKIPSEVLKMRADLIGDAQAAYKENFELNKEVMSGMGRRKAAEILEDLSRCRLATKSAIRIFDKKKEEIYS